MRDELVHGIRQTRGRGVSGRAAESDEDAWRPRHSPRPRFSEGASDLHARVRQTSRNGLLPDPVSRAVPRIELRTRMGGVFGLRLSVHVY